MVSHAQFKYIRTVTLQFFNTRVGSVQDFLKLDGIQAVETPFYPNLKHSAMKYYERKKKDCKVLGFLISFGPK